MYQARGQTCMHHACLVQEVQAQQNHKQALLQEILAQSLLREQISKIGVGQAKWGKEQTPMRPMRPTDLKVIENHAQSCLARMICIDCFDMVGDAELISSIFSSDADLEREKDIFPRW